MIFSHNILTNDFLIMWNYTLVLIFETKYILLRSIIDKFLSFIWNFYVGVILCCCTIDIYQSKLNLLCCCSIYKMCNPSGVLSLNIYQYINYDYVAWHNKIRSVGIICLITSWEEKKIKQNREFRVCNVQNCIFGLYWIARKKIQTCIQIKLCTLKIEETYAL